MNTGIFKVILNVFRDIALGGFASGTLGFASGFGGQELAIVVEDDDLLPPFVYSVSCGACNFMLFKELKFEFAFDKVLEGR